jgi:hypothetical protein
MTTRSSTSVKPSSAARRRRGIAAFFGVPRRALELYVS